VLEDGSRFKGSIDMEVPKEMGGPARPSDPSRSEPSRHEPAAEGVPAAAGAAGVKATA